MGSGDPMEQGGSKSLQNKKGCNRIFHSVTAFRLSIRFYNGLLPYKRYRTLQPQFKEGVITVSIECKETESILFEDDIL